MEDHAQLTGTVSSARAEEDTREELVKYVSCSNCLHSLCLNLETTREGGGGGKWAKPTIFNLKTGKFKSNFKLNLQYLKSNQVLRDIIL